MYNNNCIFNPSFVCPMMKRTYSNMNMGLNYNYNHRYNYNDDYKNSFSPVENETFNIKFKRVNLNELID